MNIPTWLRRRVDQKAVSRIEQLKVVRERTDRLVKQQEVQKRQKEAPRGRTEILGARLGP
jgi:hypothetical protein